MGKIKKIMRAIADVILFVILLVLFVLSFTALPILFFEVFGGGT